MATAPDENILFQYEGHSKSSKPENKKDLGYSSKIRNTLDLIFSDTYRIVYFKYIYIEQ